jgi:hypothetical protein
MTVIDVAAERRPNHRTRPWSPQLRRALPSVGVVIAYLTIAVVAFWPVFPGISHRLFGVEGDYVHGVWFLGWIPHALSHGLNPFFSQAIFVPTGVNLAQNTSSPLLGLATAPLATVFSPVVRANLVMLLGMPVSATAAFVVLRKWQIWVPAAALGGLVYGFSPYMENQSLAHLELIWLPLPPFMALTVASILQRRGSPRRLGIQLGLLAAAQYFISPEVLTTVVLLTALAVVSVGAGGHSGIPVLARTIAKPFLIALVVGGALVAYPVWMMLAGPQHFTGRTWPLLNPYHNDAFSFLIPGLLEKGGNVTEAGGYIGVPLLLVVVYLAWPSRRTPRMQLAVVVLAMAAVLSLGPYLSVDGRATGIPLPLWPLVHLPLLEDTLASRISFEVFACLAAVVAFGLDDLHRAPSGTTQLGAMRPRTRPGQGAVAVAGVALMVLAVTLIPQWPSHHPSPTKEARSLPAPLRQGVPNGDPVAITYPYATVYNPEAMLWQVEDGFRFRLLGGYAFHPYSFGLPNLLPNVMNPPALQRFLASQGGVPTSIYGPPLPVDPALVASTRTTLDTNHVRLVIVDRAASGSAPVMKLFTEVLGPPRMSDGQFSLWAD